MANYTAAIQNIRMLTTEYVARYLKDKFVVGQGTVDYCCLVDVPILWTVHRVHYLVTRLHLILAFSRFHWN